MTTEIELNRVRGTVDALSYPLSREAAVDELEAVTVLYADGEEPLADVVARSNEAELSSAADLESEIYSNLPTEAVGEPGRSEGEGRDRVPPHRRGRAGVTTTGARCRRRR